MEKKLKKWILLADDEPELIELYDSFLEMHLGDSVKILKVEDGQEATNKLPFQAFDLIITDLNMPKKSGVAFIQAVKESQMNEHTPIMVVTGEDPFDVDPQKITIMLKPVDQMKFVETVANQLKLGKTDQRVAADLLNTFIESGLYLLGKAAGLESTQQTPTAKRDGDEVEGDYMELITIKVGTLKNSFLFSFEGEVIKRLAQKSNLTSEADLRKIVQAAGDTIAKYSIRRCQNQNLQIVHSQPITKRDAEYKRVKKAKGLKIPIRTPLGLMNIYGLMQY